jgi:hypothetical protein
MAKAQTTIAALAEITRRVIARDGFSEYLPTAYFPGRSHVAVLEGVPDDVDLEKATIDWATRKADPDEEFLVAFKVDASHFKVIRRAAGSFEEETFTAVTEPGVG